MVFSIHLFPRFQKIFHHIFFKYIHHNIDHHRKFHREGTCSRWRKFRNANRSRTCKTHEVTVSISHPLTFLPLQLFGKSIFNLLEKVGLLYAEINTKRGRWFQKRKDPIFGFEGKKLIRNGAIKLQEKVVSASGNNIMFQNGDIYSAESVIWSTGFVQNYNWIEIEQAVNEKGFPNHIKGVSPVRGLYYIGLPWQSQRGSALICGVGKDAVYLLSEIKKIDQ